jgi:hypothetical protein
MTNVALARVFSPFPMGSNAGEGPLADDEGQIPCLKNPAYLEIQFAVQGDETAERVPNASEPGSELPRLSRKRCIRLIERHEQVEITRVDPLDYCFQNVLRRFSEHRRCCGHRSLPLSLGCLGPSRGLASGV